MVDNKFKSQPVTGDNTINSPDSSEQIIRRQNMIAHLGYNNYHELKSQSLLSECLSSLPISLESSTISAQRESVASISVKTNDLVNLSTFEDAPPQEFAKENPDIWFLIFAFSTIDDITKWQGVNQKFYGELVP